MKLDVADRRQGYIQKKYELLRKVYIKQVDLNVTANELVQVLRPVYGLSDAGEYWSDTQAAHLHGIEETAV